MNMKDEFLKQVVTTRRGNGCDNDACQVLLYMQKDR